MPVPTAVTGLDLSPVPGKSYSNITREWREEFIYFLMVDRFHDGTPRSPTLQPGRSAGVPTPDDFYGGKLTGITNNLDYIAGLGCTAIWLSPVFENNPGAYHGYNINNYLDIDPRFGTKQDLIDLVQAAHGRNPPMRIILDVVINHSGDNWYYPGNTDYLYADDTRFDLGGWRRGDRPIPTELRNPELYHRRGQITDNHWDQYPESQHGDIVTLKDYHNDDDDSGSELINLLIKAHCYWIREADIDGFRVDAVKHMGELACSRFCSMIREYAYSLGKRGFFLFGEAATASDDLRSLYRPEHLQPGRQYRLLRHHLPARLPPCPRRRRRSGAAARRPQRLRTPGHIVRQARGPTKPGLEPRRDRPLPGDLRRQP
jgi:alpha-amylase